jgi:hypothetical protein
MPHLVAKYKQAFSNSAYLRGPYEQTIRDRIHRVRERHHLDRRAGVWEDAPPAVPQLALPFGNAESILIS